MSYRDAERVRDCSQCDTTGPHRIRVNADGQIAGVTCLHCGDVWIW